MSRSPRQPSRPSLSSGPSLSSRVGRSLVLAAVLAVPVLGLSACDPREAGSAAVVDGTRITEAQINGQAQSVLDVFRSTSAPLPVTTDLLTSLVNRNVVDLVVAEAAVREGITVSQGQIDTLIDANGGRAKLAHDAAVQANVWVPPTAIDTLARTYLIQQALATKLDPGGDATAQSNAVGTFLVKVADEMSIAVSPRYGTWDAAKLSVTAGSDDLARPAVPTAAPSASPSAG